MSVIRMDLPRVQLNWSDEPGVWKDLENVTLPGDTQLREMRQKAASSKSRPTPMVFPTFRIVNVAGQEISS